GGAGGWAADLRAARAPLDRLYRRLRAIGCVAGVSAGDAAHSDVVSTTRRDARRDHATRTAPADAPASLGRLRADGSGSAAARMGSGHVSARVPQLSRAGPGPV